MCAGALSIAAGAAASKPSARDRDGSNAGTSWALVGATDSAAARDLLRTAGAERLAPELAVWRVPATRVRPVTAALGRAGLLRYVEPDRPVSPSSLGAGDPLATPELGWHLYRVGADRFTPPGPGVPLTVVDSGLDTTHVEFRARPGTALLNPHPAVAWNSPAYHGTYVASVAAAPADGVGALGIYPQALLRSYSVRAAFDAPLTSDVVRGIHAASTAGRTVINISLSGTAYSRSEYEAVVAAARRGALVVAAAGNEGKRGSPLEYPASLPHVLTVAATGPDDLRSAFSSTSPAVDLAAPGESIPVQHPSDPNTWKLVSGTSFATPIVAAAAAAVWTIRPDLNAGQVADVLRASARDVGPPGWDQRTGFGVLDIPAALIAPAGEIDPQEPNDDIDQIVPSRTFRSGTTPLLTRTKRTAQIRATIDGWEDPADVYRAVIPPGRTLTVTLRPSTNLAATLWAPGTKSVFTRGATATRQRLGVSNRAGTRTERIVYRNRLRAPRTVYVDVWLGRGAARRASYTLTLTTR